MRYKAESIFSSVCSCTMQTAIRQTDSPTALQSKHLQSREGKWECILVKFHVNVILSTDTWMCNLNKFPSSFEEERIAQQPLPGQNSPIWPPYGWKQPIVCLFVEVHVKGCHRSHRYASLSVAMTLPSLNREYSLVPEWSEWARIFSWALSFLASFHNPPRNTLNLHFNEIFSCY